MKHIQILLLLGMLLNGLHTEAQISATEEAAKDSAYERRQQLPHLRIGMVWMSDEVYNGQRVDSSAQWGLHPYLQWMFMKQLSFNYYGDFYSNFDPHFALSSFGIAKDFSISSAWNASAAYNYWWVHNAADRHAAPFNQNVELSLDYSFGNFCAGAYSMVLFGHSFSNFVEPSLNWSTSSWIGRKGDLQASTGITLWANFGYGDAGARPFQVFAAGSAGRKAKRQAAPLGNLPAPMATDSINRKYGWLNTQWQLSEELNKGQHHLIAGFNVARPTGNSRGFTGHWLPYVTLEYGYDMFFNKRARPPLNGFR